MARTDSRKRAGANPPVPGYARWRHLPRLVRVSFGELEDFSPARTQSIIERIEAALARERRRGRTGHWSYDINRHIALSQALRGESELLLRARAGASGGDAQASAQTSSAPASGDRRTALLTGTNAS